MSPALALPSGLPAACPRGKVAGMYRQSDFPPDVLRALWHIFNHSHHVVVDGVECAASFFHPNTVKLFDYDTHKCFRTLTAAEFVVASGAPLDVPFVAPYIYGWMFGEREGDVIPSEHLLSANPSMPSYATGPVDRPEDDLSSLPVASPLLARRTADGLS